MYSLTFEMMVQMLRQFGYTGKVHADISPRSVLKGGGRVTLIAQDGNVVDYFIFNKSGQKLYESTEAQPILKRLGVLDWQLVPLSSPTVARTHPAISLQAAKPPDKSSFFSPRRLTVPQSQMRAWSVLHRSIYLLADGTHDIEQIAALLTRPQQMVEQAIQELQAIGAIDWS